MPPKRITVEKASAPRSRAQKGYLRSTYDTLTSPENASVVRSVTAFGVAVTFLSSSWAEWLLV
ncbi:TOM core complex subunit [Diplogelasinospora grovesii]|uniref:TOM core complex subunit n=1 Tax=Diplogelasinospora grovesii TaxID=303347 RepID=A0AAN6NCS2_9PEZI|nr:TOM core complex subunit [Diplogelasinospora grovesii]